MRILCDAERIDKIAFATASSGAHTQTQLVSVARNYIRQALAGFGCDVVDGSVCEHHAAREIYLLTEKNSKKKRVR